MFSPLRSAALSWIGVIGAIFTVFSNMQSVLDFARWGHWIVKVWGDAVDATLVSFLDLFRLRIDSSAGMMVAMAAFVSAMAVGAWLQNRISGEETWEPSIRNVWHWRLLVGVSLYLLYPSVIVVASLFHWSRELLQGLPPAFVIAGHALYVAAIVVGLHKWNIGYSIYVAICMLALSYVFQSASLHRANEPNVSALISIAISLLSAVMCGILVVAFAPPKAFVWRLSMVMAGVVTLVGLNEITLLGWSIPEPP